MTVRMTTKYKHKVSHFYLELFKKRRSLGRIFFIRIHYILMSWNSNLAWAACGITRNLSLVRAGGGTPDKFSWGVRHLSWFPNQKIRTKDVVFPSPNFTAVFNRWMIKKYPILDPDSSLRTADVATTGNTSAVHRLCWFEKAQNLTLSYTKTVEATEKGSKFIPHNATQANDGVPLPGDLHFIDLCSVI